MAGDRIRTLQKRGELEIAPITHEMAGPLVPHLGFEVSELSLGDEPSMVTGRMTSPTAEAREAEARREVDEIRGEGAEPWSPSSVVSLTPGPTPRTPRNLDDTIEESIEKIVEDGPGEAGTAAKETPLPP